MWDVNRGWNDGCLVIQPRFVAASIMFHHYLSPTNKEIYYRHYLICVISLRSFIP